MNNTYELNGHILIGNGNGVYEPQEEMTMEILGVNRDIIIFSSPVGDSGEELVHGVVLGNSEVADDYEYLGKYQKEHDCWMHLCQVDPEIFRYMRGSLYE